MASKQEKQVESLLKKIVDDFKSQVDFSKISRSLLHKGIVVDFWIEELNCVIEVHGIQHYKPSSFGRNKVDTLMQFNRQLNRDNKLKSLCNQYSINYIEIPYTDDIDYMYLYMLLQPYFK
jgi:hypothetical protein